MQSRDLLRSDSETSATSTEERKGSSVGSHGDRCEERCEERCDSACSDTQAGGGSDGGAGVKPHVGIAGVTSHETRPVSIIEDTARGGKGGASQESTSGVGWFVVARCWGGLRSDSLDSETRAAEVQCEA